MTEQPQLHAASTWGSPEAPKRALLIHGLAASSHTWIDVAPELVQRGYYVVAPDLIGHGMAPRSNSYQVEDLVDHVFQRFSKNKIDLLIGHSPGGPVSLGLYARLTHKPRRMVLVNQALEIAEELMGNVKSANLDDVNTRPSAAELKKRNPNWTDNAATAKSLAVGLAAPDAIEYIGTRIKPWSFTKGLPAVDDDVEIVIIGADPQRDAVFTPEEAAALAGTRPDIKSIVATGAGHGIQREQPELIVRAALEPLESL